MFDTKGSKHLEAARLKVWPDTEWKPFKDEMPVRHLDVVSNEGRKLRIFDCTHENLSEESVSYLRRVVRKSMLSGITCCVIATNKTNANHDLMQAIYAIYPLFMFARFLKGGRNVLEVAAELDDGLFRRSALNFFDLLRKDAFALCDPHCFIGNQYLEYMKAECPHCGITIFVATGVIPLWLDGGTTADIYKEVRSLRNRLHIRPLSECYDLMASGVPEPAMRTKAIKGTQASPIRMNETPDDGNFGYSAHCPVCAKVIDGDAFIDQVRAPFIHRPGGKFFERMSYLLIMERGLHWDYDHMEAYKFDPDLYHEAGMMEPRWRLRDGFLEE